MGRKPNSQAAQVRGPIPSRTSGPLLTHLFKLLVRLKGGRLSWRKPHGELPRSFLSLCLLHLSEVQDLEVG